MLQQLLPCLTVLLLLLILQVEPGMDWLCCLSPLSCNKGDMGTCLASEQVAIRRCGVPVQQQMCPLCDILSLHTLHKHEAYAAL